MDEHQQVLKQRTPLLPTSVPNGLNEALRSIWYGRQTRQVQQRIGDEDQTPMFPNGFGTPHAIRVEAQLPLAVLIKRFHLPDIMPPKREAFTRYPAPCRGDVRSTREMTSPCSADGYPVIITSCKLRSLLTARGGEGDVFRSPARRSTDTNQAPRF